MSWRDGLMLALRSTLRRPARSLLTLMAVTLGSGLLVALGAIAQVADTRIVAQLGKGGPVTAIMVAPAAPSPSQLGSDNPRLGAPRDLDQSSLDTIRRAKGVSAVVPVVDAAVLVIPPPLGSAIKTLAGHDPDRGFPGPFDDTLVGVNLKAVHDLPITLLAGRLPSPGSMTEIAVTLGYLDQLHLDANHPAVVLGSEVELGGPQAVADPAPGGDPIRARWSRAVITGVVAQQVSDGNLLGAIELSNMEHAWQIAGIDGSTFGLPIPTSQFSELVVVADSLDDVHSVRAEIGLLGFATTAPEHLVATVQKYLHVVDIVLGAIGAIALFIAILAIANALLAAVRERRREIGVLKAIGARDLDVLRWFLTEALLLGLLGGLLGTAAGLGLAAATAAIVNKYLTEQGLTGVDLGGIPLALAALGVFGTALLSLLGATWPALRASRLPAREAVGAM